MIVETVVVFVGTVAVAIVDGLAFEKLNRDTACFGEDAVVMVGDGVVTIPLLDTCMMVMFATCSSFVDFGESGIAFANGDTFRRVRFDSTLQRKTGNSIRDCLITSK